MVCNLCWKCRGDYFFYSNLLTIYKCFGCYVVLFVLIFLSKYMSISNEIFLNVMFILMIKICLW